MHLKEIWYYNKRKYLFSGSGALSYMTNYSCRASASPVAAREMSKEKSPVPAGDFFFLAFRLHIFHFYLRNDLLGPISAENLKRNSVCFTPFTN